MSNSHLRFNINGFVNIRMGVNNQLYIGPTKELLESSIPHHLCVDITDACKKLVDDSYLQYVSVESCECVIRRGWVLV